MPPRSPRHIRLSCFYRQTSRRPGIADQMADRVQFTPALAMITLRFAPKRVEQRVCELAVSWPPSAKPYDLARETAVVSNPNGSRVPLRGRAPNWACRL